MATHAASEIRTKLEQEIVEGEFKHGDRLDEVQLANRFGVSRTPLREALRLLAGSGLVELIPRRGAFVRHPSVVELVEMFEVMAEFEAMCARLSARRMSSQDLAELADSMAKCEQAEAKDDPDGYYLANEDFHQIIYRSSGNGFLAEEARKLQERLHPYRRMQLRARGRIKQSLGEHLEICEALRDADPEHAANVMRSHVMVQGEKFHSLLAHYDQKKF